MRLAPCRILPVKNIHGSNALVEVVREIVALDPDFRLPNMKSVVSHIGVDELTIRQLAPLDEILPMLHQDVVAERLLDILIVEVHFDFDPPVRAKASVSGGSQNAAGALLQLRLSVSITSCEKLRRNGIEG